jgi:transposase-like protein
MEALNPWRMRAMARKYSDELRERATQMAADARKAPETHVGAV